MKLNRKTKKANVNENGNLVGVFNKPGSVKEAFNQLYERGYDRSDISLVMSDKTSRHIFSSVDSEAEKYKTSILRSAGIGSFLGGSVGAAAAAVIASIAGGILLPGIGITVAGPLALILSGAGAGGVGGGIIGSLIGMGLPKYKVRKYLAGIKNGNILVSFRPHDKNDADYFRKVWIAIRALEIHG